MLELWSVELKALVDELIKLELGSSVCSAIRDRSPCGLS